LIAKTRRSQGQTLLRNQKPESQKPELFLVSDFCRPTSARNRPSREDTSPKKLSADSSQPSANRSFGIHRSHRPRPTPRWPANDAPAHSLFTCQRPNRQPHAAGKLALPDRCQKPEVRTQKSEESEFWFLISGFWRAQRAWWR